MALINTLMLGQSKYLMEQLTQIYNQIKTHATLIGLEKSLNYTNNISDGSIQEINIYILNLGTTTNQNLNLKRKG
jgi:hypothetical protein